MMVTAETLGLPGRRPAPSRLLTLCMRVRVCVCVFAPPAGRHAAQGFAPPPYTPYQGNVYPAPPPAYTPPQQGFYGWVPPYQTFPDQPPGKLDGRASVNLEPSRVHVWVYSGKL